MRRKLTTLRAKQGHSQNGAPRQLIDEATLRERHHAAPHFDSEYGGWSWATRPRDQAINLRSMGPTGPSGPTGSTGPG